MAEIGSQVNMERKERIISHKERSEVGTPLPLSNEVYIKQFFSAMDIFIVPRMELEMRSVGISLRPRPGSVVLDLDQIDFSGAINAYNWPLRANSTKV